MIETPNAAELAAEYAAAVAEPARSSGDPARPAWACAAHGCPLAGALSTGGASRYCFAHFGVGFAGLARVTSWLRARPAVVAALSIRDGARREDLSRIGRELRAANLADYAPRSIAVEHEGYGRHGEGVKFTRDELGSPVAYRYRVRALVSTELERLKQGELA